MAEYGLEPQVCLDERRTLLGLEFAARDCDLDEVFGTIGLAVLLAEELDVQTEVARARQVVRVGLHTSDDLAAYDAEREDVDALVVQFVFEHFGRHRKRVAYYRVSNNILNKNT